MTVKIYKKPESKKTIFNSATQIKEYLDRFEEMSSQGIGLYLYSETKGSGKTLMVSAIANELLHSTELKIRFTSSTELINKIKSTWGNDSLTTEAEIINNYITCDVLVIDDFGTENYKDWIGERFYNIVNERYVNKRVTIYTSNESVETLDYDGRVTSRINETCALIKFPEECVREYMGVDVKQTLEKSIEPENKGDQEIDYRNTVRPEKSKIDEYMRQLQDNLSQNNSLK